MSKPSTPTIFDDPALGLNEFVLMNGTKFSLCKHEDNRLSLRMVDNEPLVMNADKMLEREALRLRDWLLASYPIQIYPSTSKGS